MGLLDRMTKEDQEFDDQPPGDHRIQTSPSTLAAADEYPLVLRRTTAMMKHLLKDVDNGTKKGKRTAYMLGKLMDEAQEELVDAPPEMIEFYLKRTSAMMFWAATGERIVNIPLPSDFKPAPELDARDVPTMTPVERAAWRALEVSDGNPDPELVDGEQRRAIMNGGQTPQ